ncbi:MAG: hypothetical protein MUF18_17850 [Fimbriiglobus sp.]|jgi:hypothetical protein|nr:hypothetical protein [Fimbriiglobus sp.]
MNFLSAQRRLVLSGLVVVAAALTGCGGPDYTKDIAAQNKSNAQRLANMYAAYQNMKNSGGPKDEADFKDWIKGYATDKLSAMGIDPNKMDDLFKSERDGKPFKIRYKVGGGRGSVAPVVFEAEGKDGKKQVAFTGGKIEEVGEPEYANLWAGKAGTQPAGAPTSSGPPAGGGGRPGSGGPPPGAPTGPPK